MNCLTNIEERIKLLEQGLKTALDSINTPEELEALRVRYLGRKGEINSLFNEISALPSDIRHMAGRSANAFKLKAISLFTQTGMPSGVKKALDEERIDITMPGHRFSIGHLHPITKTTDEICSIFTRLGFSVVEGTEIDTEYYNFEALNIPLEHPSRDAFDTFYLKTQINADNKKRRLTQIKSSGRLLLRSHTSPVQIHIMERHKPPIAIVVPGKVYRPDSVDASHSFMFYQIEGLLVNRDASFAQLKGVLSLFIKEFFGTDVQMRFRPHFFPFTEPSAEIDISCIICKGKKSRCSVCSGKGWLEILGAGMVNPKVFHNVGIDPEEWSGFAFGMGVERIAMLKYGIDDIRLFFENDIRFLKQF